MHFSWWFQILQRNLTILTFFVKKFWASFYQHEACFLEAKHLEHDQESNCCFIKVVKFQCSIWKITEPKLVMFALIWMVPNILRWNLTVYWHSELRLISMEWVRNTILQSSCDPAFSEVCVHCLTHRKWAFWIWGNASFAF